MKNIFKKLTYVILTTFIFISTLFLAFEGKFSLPFSCASDSNEENPVYIDNTLFMIDVEYAKVSNDYIFIYDNNDDMIKIINRQTYKFKETNNHLMIDNVTDILPFGDYIFVIINNGESIKCFDSHSLTEFEVDATSLNTLKTAKLRQITKIGADFYLLLSPENIFEGKFELSKITINQDTVTLQPPSTFYVSSAFLTTFEGYNDIYSVEIIQNTLVILFISNNVFSIQLDVSSPLNDYMVSTLTNAQNLVDVDEIIDLSTITLNQTNYVCVTSHNKAQLYTLSLSGADISFNYVDNARVEIDELFMLSSADAYNTTLTLISNAGQKMQIVDFDYQNGAISFSQTERSNPEVQPVLYNDNEYQYHVALIDTNIKQSPYSKDALTTIKENEHIAVIGSAIAEGEPVIGWYYCLFTKGQQNYYGYVSDLHTNELLETSYDQKYVTVLTHTNLYVLPSKIEDTTNTVIRVIPDNSRLEVLSSLNDYTSLNSKYLYVKVNNSTIGFINRDRVVEVNLDSDLILTNAMVMRNNSKIFSSIGKDKETIMEVDKGLRVKVIGKRDTISNYTKITFNDEEGNQIEGYIHTYNLEYDSWSTLQIIGMVLIIFNVILLVVIIIIKNKVTR